MTFWNEAEHPRDEEGKFIEKRSEDFVQSNKIANKGENILYGSVKKNKIKVNTLKSKIDSIKDKIIFKEIKENNKNKKRAEILYPDMPYNKKIQKLKDIGTKEFNDIEKERKLKQAKNIGLAAIEIGSTLIPGGGEAKLAAGITKSLTSKVGMAVAKEFAQGTSRGIVSGGVVGGIKGLGDGLEHDKNLVFSTLQGGLTGGTLGGILGAGIGISMGKGIQFYKGLKLNDFKSIDSMTKAERKEFRDFAKKYYQDYLQDTVVYNKDLGEIIFNAKGGKETISKNLNMTKGFPILKNDLKNAKYIRQNDLYKQRKDNYKRFYTFKGKNKIYIIAEDDKGYKFYLTKDIEIQNK